MKFGGEKKAGERGRGGLFTLSSTMRCGGAGGSDPDRLSSVQLRFDLLGILV